MKHLNTVLLLCLIMMYNNTSSAQIITNQKTQFLSASKSQLFRNSSQRVAVKTDELDKAFSAPEGGNVKLHFPNFDFEGTITSSLKRYDNLYSVVTTSSSKNKTIFSISKRTNEENTIIYVGRIINVNYADGYEDQNGHFAAGL